MSIQPAGQVPEADLSTPRIILFVCEHGAARSTIAAAYFNKLAKENGPAYKAVFRGTDPGSTITPGTKQGLIKEGFDIDGWQPQPVTESDINAASVIITFDCVLPVKVPLGKPVHQWNGIPPISQDYEISKEQIVEKVKALIKTLPR
jgi:arsenate reductase (thioredoxin)